jgi:hypothetical protein
MMRYDPAIHKIFMVDYIYLNRNDRVVHSHLTYATSRKNAEHNTRDMEHPDRINIIKITSVIQDQVFHDCVDEALATHKENNAAYMEQYRDDIIETYN